MNIFKLAWMLFWVAAAVQAGDGARISLQGLPIQLEWADVDGNGQQDLLALMLKTKTEGTVDTWLEDGALRGLYADVTTREKYLATYLQTDGEWRLAQSLPLEQTGVLGFALANGGEVAHLMLWRNDMLLRYQWQGDQQWQLERQLPTPGLLAGEAASLSDFPFWYEDEEVAYWFVPDFGGLHVRNVHQEQGLFLPYPRTAFSNSNLSRLGHKITIPLPKLMSIDGDQRPELTFIQGDHLNAYRLGERLPSFVHEREGMLADFNGDGLPDLMLAEEEDIENRKDLPNIKTHVRTYLATAPLVFAEEATADQDIRGMLVDSDEDLQLAQPFLDINQDGRMDLAGLAFKFSLFQASKILVTGRMNMKFLLSLSLQNQDGSFSEVAGGPFPMTWKINIRRLRMPSFAELTADFDGDGWIDIMMVKGGKLLVTPVTAAGIAPKPWKRSIPSDFREPDQVYGTDLDGDGRASFVLIKMRNNQTHLAILEQNR